MASVHDVAAYILSRQGSMTAMKLQKLVYYSQAWSLVWDEKPVFNERIEAWANGPVVPELYHAHHGQFHINCWPHGNLNSLTDSEKETIDAVLEHYGNMSSHMLGHLVHKESPWADARSGIMPNVRSATEITHASMAEYYGSL